jgi:hypothetical protein
MKIEICKSGTKLIGKPFEIACWILKNQRRFKLNRYIVVVENCRGE